jgi:hypothetical protein
VCCGSPACQRERRRRWQWNKRWTDTDYRQNQALAQRTWTEAHADYWQHYRLTRPEYSERNRLQQRNRDGRRRGLAKQVAPTGSGGQRSHPKTIRVLCLFYAALPAALVASQMSGIAASCAPSPRWLDMPCQHRVVPARRVARPRPGASR